MICRHASLLRAIKNLGISVNVDSNGRFVAIMGDKVVSWCEQNGYAHNIHCTVLNDGWDPQIDYFPGHFARRMRTAIEHLKNGVHTHSKGDK